jgi:hypothetical protein
MTAGRLALGLLLLAALAGCRLANPGAGPASPRAADDPPPARMAVAQGAVVVAGPRGFCIDRAASSDRGGGAALVVLSSCRALGAGLFAPGPAHPAVLTAAIAAPGRGGPGAVSAAALAAFAASAPGRRALSRAGKAETVQVLETLAGGDALLIRLSDTAPFAWGAVQPDYWRAVLAVGGRTVTVSVLALPDTPLNRDEGLRLLQDFIVALRGATQELGRKDPG